MPDRHPRPTSSHKRSVTVVVNIPIGSPSIIRTNIYFVQCTLSPRVRDIMLQINIIII